MPKVTISSSKGLEQTSGSGFAVSDVELVRSNESITPSGGSYLVTPEANTTSSLLNLHFILYAQDGGSYGVWFDDGVSGSDPGIGDAQIQVVLTTSDTKTEVAAAIATAINLGAPANADFEAVADGETVIVYALHAGAMTTTTTDLILAGDSTGTVVLTDGSDTGATVDEDVECSLLSVGTDVALMDLVTVLGNGSSVGQRKNLIFVGAASGEVNVGGEFASAGTTGLSLLSMATNSASHRAVASLVWDGTYWVVVHNVNVTAS
jgi:hypothetical protein